MSAKVTYSNSYSAKRHRIRRLPVLAERSLTAYLKRDAYGVIDAFREGIQRNNFKLARLRESTIRSKQSKGYPAPSRPLYGLGDQSDQSYMNMLRATKTSDGWAVAPSTEAHHSGRITLDHLFNIHEFGTTIRRGTSIIRIPPRPAFLKAYRRYLNVRRDRETTQEVRAAIAEYVNTGRDTLGRRAQAIRNRLKRWDAKR